MKKILSCTGFEPMTSAVLVQFSTNWANPKVWGLIPHRDSEFFLCPMFMTRWKNTSFSIYLLSSKFTISLNSFYKHYTFHIANPSSMQDACHNRPRSQWSLCGSLVKASKHRIRRSEVWFLIVTLNFFFVPRSWQDKKNISFSKPTGCWSSHTDLNFFCEDLESSPERHNLTFLTWVFWIVQWQNKYKLSWKKQMLMIIQQLHSVRHFSFLSRHAVWQHFYFQSNVWLLIVHRERTFPAAEKCISTATTLINFPMFPLNPACSLHYNTTTFFSK